MKVSLYWEYQGKTLADRRRGKTWDRGDGTLGCDECCTKMITQDGPCDHYNRESCPFCLGTGRPAEWEGV